MGRVKVKGTAKQEVAAVARRAEKAGIGDADWK